METTVVDLDDRDAELRFVRRVRRAIHRAEVAVRKTAEDVATATVATLVVSVTSGIRPPVGNAAGSVRRVENACRQLGVTCLDYPQRPVGVSEDFGWYAER